MTKREPCDQCGGNLRTNWSPLFRVWLCPMCCEIQSGLLLLRSPYTVLDWTVDPPDHTRPHP